MTREETKEIIPIMQAFADGKKIERKWINECDWIICNNPEWDWYDFNYRIAPDQEEPKEKQEKHYRPYTMEEFIADMHKHDGFIRWNIASSYYGNMITDIYEEGIRLGAGDTICLYSALCENCAWSDDGSVCGKEVEE